MQPGHTEDMRTLIALLTAGVLALAGCGTDTESATSREPAPSTDAASSTASAPSPASGQGEGAEGAASADSALYDFKGTTLDGATFEGAQLAGKPVVLWFWAPWCPTCRAQIPNVTELAEQYDGEVAVVGVGGLDDEDEIRELAEDIPNVTHLVDDEGEVWRHFGVTEQSTYTVIGADGEVEAEGYLDDEELNDLVAKLAG